MQPPPPGAQPPQYGYAGPGPQYGYAPAGYQAFWLAQMPLGPRRSVRALGWMGVGAALLGIVGSRLTWARIVGIPTQGVYVVDPVVDGREIGVGTFCLLLCVALGSLCGVLIWRPVLGCAIAVLCLGSLLSLIAGLNVVGVDRIAGPSVERYGLTASIGGGLWMTLAAGLALGIVGLGATVRATSRVRVPSRWDAPTLPPYSPHP